VTWSTFYFPVRRREGGSPLVRVLAALIAGAVLAVGASVAVVNVASPSPRPPDRPLYNYGSR